MISNNRYILQIIIEALVDSSKEKLSDSVFKKSSFTKEQCNKKISFMGLFIENLLNAIYVFEIMKENKQKSPQDLNLILSLIKRIHDPVDKNRDELSLSHFAADLSVLSSKMTHFFDLQNKIIKLYKWHNPFLTVLTLLVLTCICYSPILLIIIPIVAVLVFQLMFNNSGSTDTKRSNSNKNHSERDSSNNNLALNVELKENVINSIEFVINLAELQNMITSLLQNINKLEGFLYNNEGIKKHRSYTYFIIPFTISVCIVSFIVVHHLTGSSLFFTILIWTLFLKENSSLSNFWCKATNTKRNQLDNRYKSKFLELIFSLFNFVYLKYQKYDYLYEVQQLVDSQCNWQTLVFTKNLDALIVDNAYSSTKQQIISTKPLLKGSKKIESIVPDLGWEYIKNSQWEVAKETSPRIWLSNKKTIKMQQLNSNNQSQIFGNAENVGMFVNVEKYDLRFRRLKRKITRQAKNYFPVT